MTYLVERLAELHRHLGHLQSLTPIASRKARRHCSTDDELACAAVMLGENCLCPKQVLSDLPIARGSSPQIESPDCVAGFTGWQLYLFVTRSHRCDVHPPRLLRRSELPQGSTLPAQAPPSYARQPTPGQPNPVQFWPVTPLWAGPLEAKQGNDIPAVRAVVHRERSGRVISQAPSAACRVTVLTHLTEIVTGSVILLTHRRT
jgi:hypothetical protein